VLVHGVRRWTAERLCYNSVIGVGSVTLEAETGDSSIQQVQVNHLVAGKVVNLDVLPVVRGRFALPLQLLRGHNEIVVSPFDASERSFGLRVTFKSIWREWAETFVCSVMFALVIKTFVVQPFYIPSESMEDTLGRGDRIMVSRFDYLFRAPARQDIIVFEYPLQKGRYFIKRIVGLPTEKLEIIDRQVYVGGTPVREGYVKYETSADGISTLDSFRSLPPVKEGTYFVMGDNRDKSEDSRSWGTVPVENVVGRASFVWYPLGRMRWLR